MAHADEFGRPSVVETLRKAITKSTAAAPQPNPQAAFTPTGKKYAVEERIGRGGMGEVLLVTDHDLKRQVAMKVIGRRAASHADQLRFVVEAQATSQLDHPGVPPVHDLGLSPEGDVYFTMKLVRGRTLEEVLKDLLLGSEAVKSEYTLHRLISMLERVAETLHFAHKRGVLHRDLKPANVMLGEYGEVHVMDWRCA